MRLIYTDEAGTSEREPVAVVAAIIVHGDKQVGLLEKEISRIVHERVPSQFRQGFHIHAKDIFHGSDKEWRESWPFEERLDLLKEIGCLPFVHDVPISIAMDFKTVDWNETTVKPLLSELKITSNQYTHLLTFSNCMERADYFLRKYLSSEENGLIIAEDEPKMKNFLSKFGLMLRNDPIAFEEFHQRPAKPHLLMPPPTRLELRIDNIIEVPHFVKKKDSSLIQLADVIAFSFRRCLEKRSHGDDLVCAVLGPEQGLAFINDPVWFEVASQGVFNTDSFACEEERAAMALYQHISASTIVTPR